MNQATFNSNKYHENTHKIKLLLPEWEINTETYITLKHDNFSIYFSSQSIDNASSKKVEANENVTKEIRCTVYIACNSNIYAKNTKSH